MFLAALLLWSADLRDLSSEDWTVREAAHARLEAWLPFSLPALAATAQPDPEGDRRIETLLAPYRVRLQTSGRRLVVLWLIYSPNLEPETWYSLQANAGEHGWLHDELLCFAVERGYLTEWSRRRFYESPVAVAWKGDKFCWRLDRIRKAAGTPGVAPEDYGK